MAPQLIADAGTVVAPVTEQLKVRPAPGELSGSVTVNCGEVSLPGEDAGVDNVTVGADGAVVSKAYIAVPRVTLALPEASVARTNNL